MGEIVHENRAFKVEQYETSRNGVGRTKYRIVEPDVVVIVPVFDNGDVLIERQYRYAVDTVLYELPAGHMNAGETPKDAAARELAEETGYKAFGMNHMSDWCASPAYETKRYSYFLAKGLSSGKANMDEDEEISTVRLGIDKIVGMVRDGEIVDIKTVAGIMFYRAFGAGKG